MDGHEMPIFTRTYDLLTWLLPATNHFPRAHRQTVTRRLLDAAFDLRERLTIHPGTHPRPVGAGIPLLGFTIFPQRPTPKTAQRCILRASLACSAHRLQRQ